MKGLKIEKLFHWLYAILMLLPIFAIGVSCAYVVFNENAYQSYSDFSIYQNVQISQSQFDSNLQYTAIYNGGSWDTDNTQYSFTYLSLTASDLNISQVQRDSLTKWNWLSPHRIQLRNSQGLLIATINFSSDGIRQFSFIGNVSTNFFDGASIYQVVLDEHKLDNVFYYSFDTMKENPLFSWANNSFLSAPLLFITNLFLMPSNSAIITLMCYWFNISIIWMVFDIMIYVPRLAHKWLDKGI